MALGRVLVGYMAGHGVGVAFGVPCGLDLKSQSLMIESFSVGVGRYSVLGEAFDVCDKQKKSSTFSLAFLRTVFLACL